MFGINRKYKGKALIENKEGSDWYDYYIDEKGKIVVDKGKGSLYFPIGNIFVKIDGKVRKVNNKGEHVNDLDEFNLSNILKK
ncbi:MAG: hypothetical protein PHS92_03750 [Candidatus Gracilibacteria bacterium]|nr:hypothetical protein [Candidatus Gracilibacteria bacterium]